MLAGLDLRPDRSLIQTRCARETRIPAGIAAACQGRWIQDLESSDPAEDRHCRDAPGLGRDRYGEVLCDESCKTATERSRAYAAWRVAAR